jgi:hypothetical protein
VTDEENSGLALNLVYYMKKEYDPDTNEEIIISNTTEASAVITVTKS